MEQQIKPSAEVKKKYSQMKSFPVTSIQVSHPVLDFACGHIQNLSHMITGR